MNKSSFVRLSITTGISFVLGLVVAAIFQRINGLFFYSVFIGSIATVLIAFVLMKIDKGRNSYDKTVHFFVPLTSCLLVFSFLATIPLTIDRSYSVWILKTARVAEQDSQKLMYDEMITKSVNFFSPKNGQLQRRLLEQSRIGNLEVKETGEVVLTNKGRVIARINALIGQLFGLDPTYSSTAKSDR